MALEISRRRFVTGAGAVTVVMVVDGSSVARAARSIVPMPLPSPGFQTRILRAADQLDVHVALYNATVSSGLINPSANAVAVLTFGPQHVAEQHFAANASVAAQTATHAAAGESTVVIPLSTLVGLSLTDLLNITETTGIVGTSTVGAPPDDVSVLELPMGLLLSPATGTRMRGTSSTRTFGDVTEVWTARLEPAVAAGAADLTAVQNLHASDPVSRRPDATDRANLVSNMAIAPLTAPRLWLSSSGAMGRLVGTWDSAPSLTKYRHTVQTGRDVEVEVYDTGYLFPFGHRASIVTIAEREFSAAANTVAPMRTRTFLMIDEPRVESTRTGTSFSGHLLPFTAVRATVDENDEISTVAVDDGTVIPGAFTINRTASGAPLRVQYRGTDHDGDPITFELPATFISQGEAFKVGANDPVARLRTWYNATAQKTRREAEMKGQMIAYAPPLNGIGTTSKQSFTVEFTVAAPLGGTTELDMEGDLSPAAFPTMAKARVSDPGVGGRARFNVTYPDRYRDHGNTATNFDKVYLQLGTTQVSSIGGDTPVRGVANLELKTEVFNQTSGAGLARDNANETWDPTEALGTASEIIGGISLQDVLDVFSGPNPVPGVDIPGLTTTVDGNTITTVYSFSPALKENESVGFFTTADSRAEIAITNVVSIDGSTDPEQSVEACLYDFTLSFLPGAANPIVDVHFVKACALLSTSSGLDVTSEVDEVTLHGALGYMADLFGGAGFREPSIDVSDAGIELGVGLKLPNVSIGVLTVKGIVIDFGLFIPLQPLPGWLQIDLGTKPEPLVLSVMSFGGTFYAGILVHYGPHRVPGTDVIKVGISIYWEIIKIDMIIAKATVTLRVAADFELVGEDVVFTGRVSIEGLISFGGFIDVSLTAQLSLTYRSASETLALKGTLFWDVDTPLGGPDGKVQLGSTTIEIGNGSSSRRTRAGGDPSFGALYSADTWSEYCAAFA